MDKELQNYIDLLISRYPVLESTKTDIADAYDILEKCFASGHKLLIAGNGGSCADSEHIVGELMKGFKRKRECTKEFSSKLKEIDFERGEMLSSRLQRGLPCISLNSFSALNTAFINDIPNGGEYCFAQQVNVLGNEDDVFLGISTSGNSSNVFNAAIVGKAKGLKIIGLTGKTGGKLNSLADVCIKANATETYKIQELHLPIYHCLCLMLEEHFFGEKE